MTVQCKLVDGSFCNALIVRGARESERGVCFCSTACSGADLTLLLVERLVGPREEMDELSECICKAYEMGW
ncbi:hypothetical protein LPJGGPFB_05883 [Ensifer adhaerens]|uniref:Uncharacterized protein n=1 Tax=Ensifer adhaerens TaxID=106592 RepID=A0ACC5T308_ENSAD|nr:hypothetical protein [Ensifer adhaerens]NRP22624.1 hypothetical protein [Ensifer adhaerens]